MKIPNYMPEFLVDLDFETKSEVNIKTDTTWNYASHPSTDIFMMSYNIHRTDEVPNLDETELWNFDDPKPRRLLRLLNHTYYGIQAHNIWFEYLIWKFVAVLKYGWPEMPLEKFHCTQARCSNFGMPVALEAAGTALDLGIQKDKRGQDLIGFFSVPQSKNRRKKI